MIPADLAARLRLLTEASFFETEPPVPGLQRAREIQARLPEFLPGQRFTAALQRALPDGTFQAVVAGRQITLSLPHSAKAGDTLELVVTQTTPKAVFAELANQAAADNPSRPNLSPTGRLISFLLTGQPTAQPASLAAGKPLLNAPPAGGAALAPMLRQALAQSGMFYESHQMRWLSGKLDTASLLAEPQGQTGTPRNAAQATHGGPASTAAGQAGTAQAAATGASRGGPAGSIERAGLPAASQAESANPATRASPIPERILPVVHQQLDALATQQYVWHGQAWPGQAIEWRIDDPGGEGEGDGGGDGKEWHTSLRLTLPRLGGVEAHLYLGAAGLALRMQAEDATAAEALQAGRPALESALEAIGLSLTGMVVELQDAG